MSDACLPICAGAQLLDIPAAFADPPPPPRIEFTDISAQIAPRQLGAQRFQMGLPGSLGSGCAFLDYDNDGDEDILLVNSTAWCADEADRGDRSQSALSLFGNSGKGKFRDVTDASGLAVWFRAMGVAVGDYDNDGFRDVFVTGIGENRLWHNEGVGRFQDVTGVSGIITDNRWSTGAAWIDYDNDGLLDLVVCHYGQHKNGEDESRGGVSAYRNRGGGKFDDVSAAAGLSGKGMSNARCLGVTAVDLNNDGWMDVIVGNDGGPNFVFRNRGNGRFTECGNACGLAYDSAGSEQHSRGVDTAWYPDDPCLRVAIAARSGGALKLYSGRPGSLQFVDEAPGHGLSEATRKNTGFGVVFFDYDLDGWPDLLVANGDSDRLEPLNLFWNAGQHTDLAFQRVSAREAGLSMFMPLAGRSVAYADVDGDYDSDILITQNSSSPVLLRNDQQTSHRALRVRLIGTRSNRDAIGARITLHSAGHFLRAQVMPTRGYLSQSELPVTFGLGGNETTRGLEIRWPSGLVQKLRVKPTERSITVVEPLKGGLADSEP